MTLSGAGDPVREYLDALLPPEPPALAALLAEEAQRNDLQPSVGPDVGRLLALLVRSIQARRVLELGTSLGYSTLVLAAALRETGGRLTSVEIRPELAEAARAALRTAALDAHAEVVTADARAALDALEGPFDLILQDSAKALYPELAGRCVELLRPGGLLVADDALFPPRGVRADFSRPVDEYNRLVAADPRLFTVILPLGDGVAISWKR